MAPEPISYQPYIIFAIIVLSIVIPYILIVICCRCIRRKRKAAELEVRKKKQEMLNEIRTETEMTLRTEPAEGKNVVMFDIDD